VALILTQNSGGSGTFYHIAVLLSSKDGYRGTNTIFFGDRIAFKTIKFIDGEIVVNYLDRNLDEPMVAFPTVDTSKYFKVNNGELMEIQK
jgi:hypothetical protein